MAAARAPREVSASALPEQVAALPRKEVAAEPSPLARQFMNGGGPGNMFPVHWRNESSGATGIVR